MKKYDPILDRWFNIDAAFKNDEPFKINLDQFRILSISGA